MGWGGGGEILKRDNEIISRMGWGGGGENFETRISLFLTRLVCPKRTVLSVTLKILPKKGQQINFPKPTEMQKN